jgi:hypothetical protein
MDANHQVKFQRELQSERIDGRKAWVHYVELKTAMYRAHAAQIEAELGPIVDDLLRHEKHRTGYVLTPKRR